MKGTNTHRTTRMWERAKDGTRTFSGVPTSHLTRRDMKNASRGAPCAGRILDTALSMILNQSGRYPDQLPDG